MLLLLLLLGNCVFLSSSRKEICVVAPQSDVVRSRTHAVCEQGLAGGGGGTAGCHIGWIDVVVVEEELERHAIDVLGASMCVRAACISSSFSA